MKKAKIGFCSCFRRFKKFLKSKYFLPSIILIVLIVVAFITALALQKPIRERARAGGTCLPAGSTKIATEPSPPSCCPGLNFIHDTKPNEQGICTAISSNEVPTLCSNCGNGSCEPWENHCNCHQDCLEQQMVDLKIKFQCVNQKPAITKLQIVKVKIASASGEPKEIPDARFYPQDDGTYLGFFYPEQHFFNTPLTIYIKGPKHLQRKFITNNQGQNIILTQNTTNRTQNLTHKILEAGDLPPQNGRVDRSDYDTLISKITIPYSEEFDINLDVAINMVDVSCLIDTLSVKPEEE
jgi:hypothetical protein